MTIRTLHIPAGGGFEHVTVGSTQPVEPRPGEITVRLRASSLNFHDYMVVKGVTGPTEQRIPMSDGAGEVIAVGDGVSGFDVGDHVVSTFFPDWLDGEPQVEGFARTPGDGIDGYAREQVSAPATSFTRAPRGWSHAEAATLTTAGLTAWRALMDDGALKPGEVVLVQGTGGVSIFALQFAKLAGARVIATSSSDAKLERLRELGADEVINYREDPDWGLTARRMTGGNGVDHVLDVGGPATLAQSMLASRVGGHVALIGVLTGVDGQLPLGLALGRQLRLQALVVGSRRQQQDMVRALEAGTLRPVIDRHFALDDLVAAFRHQESGSHFGKIVLDI
ncbi:NAD(P)-dependent alcohol dehydrogenase [Luteimonas yindakuii]|uniref:zinc-dependent alcohol dehydrogenase family protein n=1 Tax=Luteimonas yindakuii TaxID=2565782 RepID=UPI0010A2CFE3|nr:NAD(P)-dependent alcohol dehydrogenase [Luteimonas yindakuii]